MPSMKRWRAMARVRQAEKPSSTSTSPAGSGRPASAGSRSRLGSLIPMVPMTSRAQRLRGAAVPKVLCPVGRLAVLKKNLKLSACERKAVRPATQVAYEKYATEFWEWEGRQRSASKSNEMSVANLEEKLVEYMDDMMLKGRTAQEAEKVVAAVLHFNAAVSRAMVPRVTKALRGFRKHSPPKSRVPMPEEIMAGVCAVLQAKKEKRMALAVATCFYTYLRPGEARKLLTCDLVRPPGGAGEALQRWSLVVAPEERLEMSKTQTFDDTVLLDSPSFLGPQLQIMAGHQRGEHSLFQLAASNMLKAMKAACEELRITPPMGWYQLRHGGASADLLCRRRSITEIQARGRWRKPESMRRYAKSGQVGKTLNRLEPVVREFTQWSLKHLDAIMTDKVAVALPVGSQQAEPASMNDAQ